MKFASARWSETCAVQGMRAMIGVVCFLVRGREGELRHQGLERFQRIRANDLEVVFRGLWGLQISSPRFSSAFEGVLRNAVL